MISDRWLVVGCDDIKGDRVAVIVDDRHTDWIGYENEVKRVESISGRKLKKCGMMEVKGNYSVDELKKKSWKGVFEAEQIKSAIRKCLEAIHFGEITSKVDSIILNHELSISELSKSHNIKTSINGHTLITQHNALYLQQTTPAKNHPNQKFNLQNTISKTSKSISTTNAFKLLSVSEALSMTDRC